MSEETKEVTVETPSKEMVEVQKPLSKAYDMLAEANTIIIDKDIYKPEHLEKKLGDLYQSIEEGTGIPHPSRLEAESLRKEGETLKASLDASNADLAKFKEESDTKVKELEAAKSKLEKQLEKYKDAKFGKFDDKEGTVKVEDHKAKYHEILKTNPHEAAKYFDKNIEPLHKTSK